jgi:hypothetical protein
MESAFGSMLLMNSIQHRHGAGGNLEGVAGGAMTGMGMASTLGMTSLGGAVFGAGAGLFLGGMMRGGVGGTLESTAGGAIMGMQLAGPIGAAIGAGVGLIGGIARTIFGGDDDQTHASKLIQQIYGVSIPRSSGVIKQIVELAHTKFGNSISMAVRSPDVRELIQLYAESTGQKSNLFLLDPQAAHLVQNGGGLYQGLTYQNGTGYAFASAAGLPTLGSGALIPTQNPYASMGSAMNNIYLDSEATVNLISQGSLRGIQSNPGAVAQSAGNGYAASAARLSTAAGLLSPSVITS